MSSIARDIRAVQRDIESMHSAILANTCKIAELRAEMAGWHAELYARRKALRELVRARDVTARL